MENGPGSARRLLGVFAHPDDEVFCAGGTMARAAEAGAEVMIVSATRGELGQIRDPAAATRRTLGAVREEELRAAAAELGVQRVQALAYPDGTLQRHRSSLGAATADIMRHFDPDTVITFGADGGYGHPDHVAISELTTAAFRALVRDHNRGQRLYHAVFPPRRTCMAEELARWIAGSGQRAADRAALQAIALFAGEAATMRLARDDVRTLWFPPGTCVIEQGEPADALYLILTGTADALREHPGGQVIHLRRMQAGDFFGEHGLVAGQGTAHVVARDSLTCLVLSRTPIRPYAGRGADAAGAPRRRPPRRRPTAGNLRGGRHQLPSPQARGAGAAPHPVPGRSVDASPTPAARHARYGVLPQHRRRQRGRRRQPLREGAASPAASSPVIARPPWPSLDTGGFLTIADRKEELIITSGGKNISLVLIESLLARADQVRRFALLPAEWTAKTGELTPTLKRRRRSHRRPLHRRHRAALRAGHHRCDRRGTRLASIPGAVIELSPAPAGGDVDGVTWADALQLPAGPPSTSTGPAS